MGYAVSGRSRQGQELRPGRHQRPQCFLPALAQVAGCGEPLRGAVHQLLGERAIPDGRRPPIWFALDESRPIACFAGIWTRWTSVRKVREGETTNDVFAFLTTEPNTLVGRYHPKAMPVILRTAEEIDIWMSAPASEAFGLQRPLPDEALVVVLRGEKEDVGGLGGLVPTALPRQGLLL